MFDERTQSILEAVVREFLETGDPVSSGWLFDRYNFGIRPAMIRAEMNDLTERGYLGQPHHSAGRLPTNRGLQFFADHILEEVSGNARIDNRIRESFERESWSDVLERLSDALGLLSVAADTASGEVYKEGLENLVENLEWSSRNELTGVIRDFEELDERLTDSACPLNEENFIKIFIGRKSPITRSEYLSVVAGDYTVHGKRVILCAIGPRRMNYTKTAGMFKELKQAKHHG